MFRYKNTKTKTREEERFSRFDVILGFFLYGTCHYRPAGGMGLRPDYMSLDDRTSLCTNLPIFMIS